MAIISKHNGKEEWECHHWECWGVCLTVHGHSISVGNLLESPHNIVHFEVGRRLYLMRFVVIWSPRLKLGRCKDGKFLSKSFWQCYGNPNESNISFFTTLHHVQGCVNSLFFCYEHKHNFKRAGVQRIAVNWTEILFKLVFWKLYKVLTLLLLYDRLIQSLVNGVELGDLKSWSHERITYLLDSVADNRAVLVHYHVHSFLLSIRFLFIGPKVSQSLSSCYTVEHSSHAVTFIIFYGARDKWNGDAAIVA